MDAAVAAGRRGRSSWRTTPRRADVAACAASLAAVIDSVDDTPVQFVNLSESLPLDRLGVDGLLSESGLAGSPARLVAALRPVTNTVCANLYRTSFLTEVAAGIRDRGLVPVAPIDWRVNEQIMRMWNDGTVGRGLVRLDQARAVPAGLDARRDLAAERRPRRARRRRPRRVAARSRPPRPP